MAPTLDATLSGSSSNSYVTLAEATAIAQQEAFADQWNSTSDDDLIVGLIAATRWLETIDFAGDRCKASQRLKWPRIGAVCDGVTSDCAGIPFNIQEAEVILAWKYTQSPTLFPGGDDSNNTQDGVYVSKQQLGDLVQEFSAFPSGAGESSCDDCNQPAIIRSFPWLLDLLGCWANLSRSSSKVILRVRS